MAVASPPLLSGLATTLLQPPPSFQELIIQLHFAEDYTWFTNLVHPLFPEEAEAALAVPSVTKKLQNFAQLFQEKHFPLHPSFIDFLPDGTEEPPFTQLRLGIPFDLMGFGYDCLHQIWQIYREGIAALALLAEPLHTSPDEPDGMRTAWLESAAEHIPQETLQRIPPGGIPLTTLTQAVEETEYTGAAHAVAWVRSETDNFFLDLNYEDGEYDGFADPWEEEIIHEGTEEWRKAKPLITSVTTLANWLEEDLPSRFAELLDFVLPRLPDQQDHRREP